MIRFAFMLLAALLPALAQADVVFYYTTGTSLYVRFDDASNTAVNLTEGSSLKLGRYVAADAAIDSAGLAAGTYSGRIFIGTAGAQASGDVEVGVLPEFIFGASTQTTSYEELVAQIIASSPLAGFFTNQPEPTVDEVALADAVADALEGQLGQTQPRVNFDASPGFTVQIGSGADGTYKATPLIRVNAGLVQDVYVFIDMKLKFGAKDYVHTVGTPVVSGGSITAEAEGPRDTYAVVKLEGTATASESRTVRVPVTMVSGTTVPVVFDVKVFAE